MEMSTDIGQMARRMDGSVSFKILSFPPPSYLIQAHGGLDISSHKARGLAYAGQVVIWSQGRKRQQFTLTFTPMVNLTSQIKITPYMFLDCGSNSECPEKIHKDMPHKKLPVGKWIQTPVSCEANHCTYRI